MGCNLSACRSEHLENNLRRLRLIIYGGSILKRFLVLLSFMMVPVLAHGATYYVSKTGSDAHGCSTTDSAATNTLTISAGARCLSPGDTLVVHAGTYTEGLNNIVP